MPRRLSRQTASLLGVMADDQTRWRFGYELMRELDLQAGSVYPILIRLCDRGLLESSWEADGPGDRPPRHLYRITPDGVRLAASVAFPRPDVARGSRHPVLKARHEHA